MLKQFKHKPIPIKNNRTKQMITRRKAAIERFRNVLENPVVLSHVLSHMGLDDLKSMLVLSKDGVYRELLQERLQRYKEAITYLRDKLTEHSICTSYQQRKQTSMSIYEYLCDNQWILVQNPRLHKVVLDKLEELSTCIYFKSEAGRFMRILPRP